MAVESFFTCSTTRRQSTWPLRAAATAALHPAPSRCCKYPRAVVGSNQESRYCRQRSCRVNSRDYLRNSQQGSLCKWFFACRQRSWPCCAASSSGVVPKRSFALRIARRPSSPVASQRRKLIHLRINSRDNLRNSHAAGPYMFFFAWLELALLECSRPPALQYTPTPAAPRAAPPSVQLCIRRTAGPQRGPRHRKRASPEPAARINSRVY